MNLTHAFSDAAGFDRQMLDAQAQARRVDRLFIYHHHNGSLDVKTFYRLGKGDSYSVHHIEDEFGPRCPVCKRPSDPALFSTSEQHEIACAICNPEISETIRVHPRPVRVAVPNPSNPALDDLEDPKLLEWWEEPEPEYVD